MEVQPADTIFVSWVYAPKKSITVERVFS